ncbi:hypothetical protein SAMN04488077_11469 [Roseovarius tolerans]|uniref:Uncharacterized protein n=1 Tax=Roseovarius tolerans TaxID=74031 RepID=A0A1H8F4V5_9RHOB|nr:hypothetical protein [Roseovarius tolerans]SEN26640.1 hypothetical protein SAMN04488077_11469 [Roseovarius tolerans]
MHLNLTFPPVHDATKGNPDVHGERICRLGVLSICETLLLAMNDHGLLPEHEIVGLRDAAATHENAVGIEFETERHHAVSDLINAIIAGGNSVRRL